METVEIEPAVEAVYEPMKHKVPVMEEYVVQEAQEEKRETVVVQEAREEKASRAHDRRSRERERPGVEEDPLGGEIRCARSRGTKATRSLAPASLL